MAVPFEYQILMLGVVNHIWLILDQVTNRQILAIPSNNFILKKIDIECIFELDWI